MDLEDEIHESRLVEGNNNGAANIEENVKVYKIVNNRSPIENQTKNWNSVPLYMHYMENIFVK